ncbi:MobA/MobL family protein [Desulfopila sp. IMCC35006]|uniref:MobA/MobL family protein n=1 Tax=Desulfopila sp. IMCC35006 TaxID=2569542 RepID=UPI002689040F
MFILIYLKEVIYIHSRIQIIGRSADRDVVCKSAYNSRSNEKNHNTGITHYHRSKGRLIYEEILIPPDSPDWLKELAKDRGYFWSAVDKREGRCDSQLAREINIPLLHELSDQQNIELFKTFVQQNFVEKGMVADIAIHRAPKDGDPRNVHGHATLSMREITPDGFGNKDRSWNDQKLARQWRKSYCNLGNLYLVRNGFEPRLDHRSFAERNIDKEPTRYQGRSYRKSKQKGKERNVQKGPINVMETLREILQENDQDRENDNFENER